MDKKFNKLRPYSLINTKKAKEVSAALPPNGFSVPDLYPERVYVDSHDERYDSAGRLEWCPRSLSHPQVSSFSSTIRCHEQNLALSCLPSLACGWLQTRITAQRRKIRHSGQWFNFLVQNMDSVRIPVLNPVRIDNSGSDSKLSFSRSWDRSVNLHPHSMVMRSACHFVSMCATVWQMQIYNDATNWPVLQASVWPSPSSEKVIIKSVIRGRLPLSSVQSW